MATPRTTSRSRLARALLALVILMPLAACGEKQLVEVFDNGPAGGPKGPSEGYIWVNSREYPPPGKTWAPVDPDTLTSEQKQRIRN